jgi:hypothetical protein
MKNVSKFYTELVFTVIVAGIGSWLLAFLAWFLLANFNVTSEAKTYVDFVSGILFGLIVGYKLKTLMLVHTKPAKKKK